MNVRPDLRKETLSVTEPADSSGQLLPEELGMDSVDVVIGVLLCEPHPGVIVVLAVEADDSGQIGDVGASEGAGNHALLDLVNLPDVILDAGKSQRCDANPAVLEHNMCLVFSAESAQDFAGDKI